MGQPGWSWCSNRWATVSQRPEPCTGSAAATKGPSPPRGLSKYSEPVDYTKFRENEKPQNARTKWSEGLPTQAPREPGETSWTWVSTWQVLDVQKPDQTSHSPVKTEGDTEDRSLILHPHKDTCISPSIQMLLQPKYYLLWVELCPPRIHVEFLTP